MTICNLYRVIPYPGKVKISTITDESSSYIDRNGYAEFISRHFLPSLKIRRNDSLKFSWKPSIRSSKGPGALEGMNTMSGFGDSLYTIMESPLCLQFQRYCRVTGLTEI